MMKTKADCDGKTLPDVIHRVDNEAITGKALGYWVDETWHRCDPSGRNRKPRRGGSMS